MNSIESIYFKSKKLQWIFKSSPLSRMLHGLIPYYHYFEYKRLTYIQNKEQQRRSKGKLDPRFEKIKQMKGVYKGKRCFITCTGPSLTIEDLELLKNEYVFGMNSICLIHDKTDWKPDFYGIQDVSVFKKLREKLLSTDNGIVFAPYELSSYFDVPNDWFLFHISWAYHMYDRQYRNKFYARFSDDCYATVFDGFSITYSIMQIAIYLGFDELYLLGADCTYLGKKQHFIETGHYAPLSDLLTATDRLVASYTEAKKYADSHGIRILNATRGGCLEIFPRVSLEEVLANQVKNKSCGGNN